MKFYTSVMFSVRTKDQPSKEIKSTSIVKAYTISIDPDLPKPQEFDEIMKEVVKVSQKDFEAYASKFEKGTVIRRYWIHSILTEQELRIKLAQEVLSTSIQLTKIDKLLLSVIGKSKKVAWLIDVDCEEDLPVIESILTEIGKEYKVLPTKNFYSVIVFGGFDSRKLEGLKDSTLKRDEGGVLIDFIVKE